MNIVGDAAQSLVPGDLVEDGTLQGLILSTNGDRPLVLWSFKDGSCYICNDDTARLQWLLNQGGSIIDQDFHISNTVHIMGNITIGGCRFYKRGDKDQPAINVHRGGQLVVMRDNYIIQVD